MARRYRRSDEPLDDLIQVATLGLIKAIDRFDPSRGLELSTFATPTILGEIRRHFRDRGWAMHVPRGIQERYLTVRDATDLLTSEMGRSPAIEDISAATGMPVEDVIEAREARVPG